MAVSSRAVLQLEKKYFQSAIQSYRFYKVLLPILFFSASWILRFLLCCCSGGGGGGLGHCQFIPKRKNYSSSLPLI